MKARNFACFAPLALCLCLGLVIGCGGNGENPSKTGVTNGSTNGNTNGGNNQPASLRVNTPWSTDDANILSYGLSARIVATQGSNVQDVVMTRDESNSLDLTLNNYAAGTTQVQGYLYASVDGTGTPIATFTQNVALQGGATTTISPTFTDRVATIRVRANNIIVAEGSGITVTQGTQVALRSEAVDENGNVLDLPSAAFTYSTETAAVAAISNTNRLNGVSVGTTNLVVGFGAGADSRSIPVTVVAGG